MPNAHDVYKLIRSVTLDVDGTVYRDDILLPAVQAAARDLVTKLMSRGYETTEDTVTLALAAGVTVLDAASTPPLPADFAVPQRLWEKMTGASGDYVPMYPVDDIPTEDATERLRVWQWQKGKIRLLGASVPVTVKLEYQRSIMPITSSGSSIDAIPGCLNYLAYGALKLVGVGRADSDMLDRMELASREALESIIDTYVSAGQFGVARRAPYGTLPEED